MEFEVFKKEAIEHFTNSDILFSNKNKKSREIWVVKKFLDGLGLSYMESELCCSANEPPDIIFRDAKFEIMEKMDEGRRRHKEYKDKLKKIKAAQNYSEITFPETWAQEMITLQKLLCTVDDHIQKNKGHYCIKEKAKIDALIYINLRRYYIEDEDFEFSLSADSRLRQWRSVSLVFNRNIVCAAFASDNAPAFIRTVSGLVIKRD